MATLLTAMKVFGIVIASGVMAMITIAILAVAFYALFRFIAGLYNHLEDL